MTKKTATALITLTVIIVLSVGLGILLNFVNADPINRSKQFDIFLSRNTDLVLFMLVGISSILLSLISWNLSAIIANRKKDIEIKAHDDKHLDGELGRARNEIVYKDTSIRNLKIEISQHKRRAKETASYLDKYLSWEMMEKVKSILLDPMKRSEE